MTRSNRYSPRSRVLLPLTLSIILVAASLGSSGCSGAFYGGATGGYLATAGYGYNCIDYGGAADPPRQCGGGADAAFVVGAIVIGATIGAVIEIIKWLSHGGDPW